MLVMSDWLFNWKRLPESNAILFRPGVCSHDLSTDLEWCVLEAIRPSCWLSSSRGESRDNTSSGTSADDEVLTLLATLTILGTWRSFSW